MKKKILQNVVNAMTTAELKEFLFDNSPENATGDYTREEAIQDVVGYCKKKKISGTELYEALHGLDSVTEQH